VARKNHGHEERRQREEQEGQRRNRVVVAAVLAECGRDADQDAQDDRQQRGSNQQLHRDANRRVQHRDDRLPVARSAEVELSDEDLEHAAEPDEIPQWDRHIEVQQSRTLLD
jgi:hypothetical protein